MLKSFLSALAGWQAGVLVYVAIVLATLQPPYRTFSEAYIVICAYGGGLAMLLWVGVLWPLYAHVPDNSDFWWPLLCVPAGALAGAILCGGLCIPGWAWEGAKFGYFWYFFLYDCVGIVSGAVAFMVASAFKGASNRAA